MHLFKGIEVLFCCDPLPPFRFVRRIRTQIGNYITLGPGTRINVTKDGGHYKAIVTKLNLEYDGEGYLQYGKFWVFISMVGGLYPTARVK